MTQQTFLPGLLQPCLLLLPLGSVPPPSPTPLRSSFIFGFRERARGGWGGRAGVGAAGRPAGLLANGRFEPSGVPPSPAAAASPGAGGGFAEPQGLPTPSSALVRMPRNSGLTWIPGTHTEAGGASQGPSTDPGMPVFRQSCSESYKPQVRGLKDSNSTIKTGKTRLVFVCLLSSGSDGKQPLPPLGWRRPHLSPGPPRAVTKVTRPSEPFSLLAFGPGSPLLLPHCRPGLESPSYLPHPTPRPMPLNVFSWCELERGEGGLVGPPRRLRMLRGPVFCSPSSCGGRQRVTPCGPEPQPGKSRGTRPTLAPEPTVGALKLPGGLLAQRTGPPLTRLPRDGRKKSGLPALLTRERVEPPVSRPAWPEEPSGSRSQI
ncbi:uncharacterized protein LOC105749442 isoform X2 [Sarcophilus harrisii]|uniref:uncharacterized protein LOC105749442 isoform X2 n=1 Tax=Sarcophilus harrisii TaxID=9305 RepID=UPI001301B0BF|nr:uncharacterized protein LOC105749442 isoform X2 [Sarcophilus harrisii]